MLETIVSSLDGDEPWRQRPPHGIRRAVIRAASAVGAGIEIEHVLPGEVFELLNPERFHLVEVIIGQAPLHRFHRAFVQLCEVDVEQRRDHVELDAKGPVAQQKVKGEFV